MANPKKSEVKHFGSGKKKTLPEVPFTIDVHRDDTIETMAFTARPDMTYGDTIGLVQSQTDDDGTGLLPHFDRFIRRSLSNNDGTPAKWRPVIVDGHFTAPNGDRTPTAELDKVLAFEAGSSRRRWIDVMTSEDMTVELEDVLAVFEYLVSEAGGNRPT